MNLKKSAEPKFKLIFVALHLTYVCGNKCAYCYIGDEGRKKHPSFKKIELVIKKLAQSKITHLLLVGGDPCIYPDLKETVELAKKSGMNIYILSNTLNFDKKNLDYFISNIDEFHATIQGYDEKTHDLEAGRKGAYKTLLKNIRILNKNDTPIGIELSIHADNHKNIFKIIQNLVEKEKIKILELCVQRIVPCGRAAKNPKYAIRKEQILIIFDQLQQIRQNYGLKINFEDPFPLCTIPKEYRSLQNKVCEWGFTKASVNFKGDLSRCGADTRFLLGNILKTDNVQELWNKNSILVDFRSRKWLPKQCKNCKLLEKCGGGCSLSRITNKDHDCDALCPFC